MFASLFALGEAAHCEAERAQIAQLEAETAVLRAKIAHAAPSDDPAPSEAAVASKTSPSLVMARSERLKFSLRSLRARWVRQKPTHGP